jgi:D-aminopeptidase
MTRARDLGIVIGTMPPGRNNAITDVEGVMVGHTTLIEGDGSLEVGHGPIRTGVTVVLPHEGGAWKQPLFAGCHRLNGNGEMTGLEWIRESGMLTSPIAITNTHSVGVVRDALVSAEVGQRGSGTLYWSLPVAAETWDGALNDINGMHVTSKHVHEALDAAAGGPVAEGNVGGGTGMICHEFKGGIGTSSRVVPEADGGYTVGVLVQSNYGDRERLRIDGVPVGREIPYDEVPAPEDLPMPGAGSIIIVVATDAPLLPNQLDALAQRAGLGVARMGGSGAHSSGDLFISFSTGNRGLVSYKDEAPARTVGVQMLSNHYITPLFNGVIEATEEAITNALVAAETMVGRDGATAHRLPHDRLVEVMSKYRPAS